MEENANQVVVFFYTAHGCSTIKAEFTKPLICVSQSDRPACNPGCVRMCVCLCACLCVCDRSVRSIAFFKGGVAERSYRAKRTDGGGAACTYNIDPASVI